MWEDTSFNFMPGYRQVTRKEENRHPWAFSRVEIVDEPLLQICHVYLQFLLSRFFLWVIEFCCILPILTYTCCPIISQYNTMLIFLFCQGRFLFPILSSSFQLVLAMEVKLLISDQFPFFFSCVSKLLSSNYYCLLPWGFLHGIGNRSSLQLLDDIP